MNRYVGLNINKDGSVVSLDKVEEKKEDLIKRLLEQEKKSSFLIGTLVGKISCLLRDAEAANIDKEEICNQLKNIWSEAAHDIDEIYYKNKN
jgi:hypothetical protein